jgi:hypothetical protein
MSDLSESILIAVLVIVILMFLLQIELYRNMLAIVAYNSNEAAPPLDLRFTKSFIDTPNIPGTRKTRHS